MGVVISVYTNIKKSTVNDYCFRAFVLSDKWNDRIKNLEINSFYKGQYHPQKTFEYSSTIHNTLRSELCEILNRHRNEWKDDMDDSIPFYELFEFGDNEGCMDWESCSNLYDDFMTYKKQFMLKHNNNQFARDIYQKWIDILKCAKDNKGVIVFT